MSPRFVLGRENVACVAEVVNRSLKAQSTDFTEVPLGWVAIFELRYRDGFQFLPFGIRMGCNFFHQV